MNYIKYIVLGALILHSFAGLAKTGYVNMVVAIEKTKQGKRAKNKLEGKLAQAKKSMKAIEVKLSKQRTSLEKEAPLLSEQSRAQRISQFQSQVAKSQQKAEAKQLELKKYEESLMGPIIKKMNVVVTQVANKGGFDLIRNTDNSVLWVSPSLDVTKKVYTEFNKKNK